MYGRTSDVAWTILQMSFLGLEHISCVAVYAGQKTLGLNKKYIKLGSEDERKSSVGLERHGGQN